MIVIPILITFKSNIDSSNYAPTLTDADVHIDSSNNIIYESFLLMANANIMTKPHQS